MTEQLTLDGAGLRDLGAEVALENAGAEWRDNAEAAIDFLARSTRGTQDFFTAEDVRRIAGDPPGSPNAVGAVFLAAKKRGAIVVVGESTATRREAHATRLRHYRGVL